MRCNHCPVKSGLPCLGQTHRVGDSWPLCRDVANGLPGRAEQLVALAEGKAPPSRPPSDLDVRLAMAADLCPSGTGPCGCSGPPRSCGRDGRPAEVWRRDCLECVSRDWWQAGVEAGW